MIEQTELIVSKWHYYPPANPIADMDRISNNTTLEVMRKRAPTKKGLACRLSCSFALEDDTILDYVAEHSYVIDLDDVIDKNELLSMIRNSYAQFNEKFELRKLGTILQDKSLRAMDESLIDTDSILPLLV